MTNLRINWLERALKSIWQQWQFYQLADQRFGYMFDYEPVKEWVALDCETTGLSIQNDEIISIGAVKIVDNRILTSERLELIVRSKKKVSTQSMKIHRLREMEVAQGLSPEVAMEKLIEFIGSRPLVGYYLEFDIAMINKTLKPMLGIGLPQSKIEVSSLYYDYKNNQLPHHEKDRDIDLRFSTIMKDLKLPTRAAHDAMNDAVMAAMAFIKLRELIST